MSCLKNSIITIALLVVVGLSGSIDADKRLLIFNDQYAVMWEIVGEKDKEVVFEILVKTTGFVGFGLSPNGAMAGSDIIIGGVMPDGTPYLSDRHGVGNSEPIVDAVSNYKLIESMENATHTYLKVSRLLDTCDNDDFKITESTFKFIWSYGLTDTISYHGADNRGSQTVNLLDPEMPAADMSKFQQWNLTATTHLPANDTVYWCTIHKTPTLSKMHHMIGFNAILPSDISKKHTHHIDIYKCEAPEGKNASEIFGPYVGLPGADCYDPESLSYPFTYCEWIQYGWATGGDLTLWPDNIGFQFNGDEYFMLEIHYDNPLSSGDIEYETGMIVYYSEEIREITAAQFLVGSIISFTQTVPPMEPHFITTAHCHADCTNEFPPEGITVFNMLLHSHKSGHSIRVRHFRNGTELPWIISDDTYDFNYQQNRPMQEFKLLPGDHITVECTYDTTWKQGLPVIGGRATTEEMCIAFFNYYPRMPNLVECNSEMPEKELLDFFGIETYDLGEFEEDPTVTAPEDLKGKKYSHVVRDFNWTQETRAEFQRKARYEPHNGECIPVGPSFETGFPEYQQEWVPPNTCGTKNNEQSITNVGGKIIPTGGFISIISLISIYLVLFFIH